MRQLKISKQITNREADSLDKYLQEVSKCEMITAEEEVILANKIKEGNTREAEDALRKLTTANLRFVISVAKQYQNQGLSLADLINEGNIGLIKAAKKFDQSRGFKFISYAVWWIRQSILQAIAEHSRVVRLPLNKIGTLNKINRTFVELEQKYEREPSVTEVAKELEMEVKDVKNSLLFSNKQISFDAPLNDGESDSSNLYEIFVHSEQNRPDEESPNEALKNEITRALDSLPKKEAEILRLYYGINQKYPLTLEEIGETFKINRERVRQLKEKGLRKLKQKNRKDILKNHL